MEILQVLLYVSAIVCLVSLTVLCIKLILSLKRVNVILDDVEDKITTINKIFNVIDRITDGIATTSDKVIDKITLVITKLLLPRKKKKDNKKLENKEE